MIKIYILQDKKIYDFEKIDDFNQYIDELMWFFTRDKRLVIMNINHVFVCINIYDLLMGLYHL